jgi:predicted CXXCH cytochrome family protein
MIPVKRNISVSLMVIVFSFLLGCSHKVLTVFFDGVPDKNDSINLADKQTGKKADSTLIRELAANEVASKNKEHPPYARKKCELCHDPNRNGKLLEPQPGLCYQCHDAFEAKFEHGPVVSGNCTSCHSPHKSDNPKLLLRTGQALCLKCHDSGRLMTAPEHEKVADSSCTICHNPHGGNKRYFLK